MDTRGSKRRLSNDGNDDSQPGESVSQVCALSELQHYRPVHMESTFDAHSIPKLTKTNWKRIQCASRAVTCSELDVNYTAIRFFNLNLHHALLSLQRCFCSSKRP